jgi:4-aminobutyrate aminotransferase-like enzyme
MPVDPGRSGPTASRLRRCPRHARPRHAHEGILDAPACFIAGLLDGAHRAGALFLADEVQAGFGRPGPALWRFAAAGVTPDFVTLGKPMGADYPIGALITRREIADSLARDYEYFSTFAGTPASATSAAPG